MRRWLTALAFSLSVAPSVAAQEAAQSARQAQPPSLRAVSEMIRSGKVMPAIAMLEELVEADPAARATGAQYWAFSGDIETADALFDRSFPMPGGPEPDLSAARPEPAIEAIVREARGKRVVMINEAHHAPRHRAFTHRLMLALRREGFTHLAAETFCSGCPEVLEGGAPTPSTGVYTADPVFADLARQAGAAGYVLLGYETRAGQSLPAGASQEEQMARRELAQAENLKAALDADPDMRVLVHVGFGHLYEMPLGTLEMFGGQLKRLTGEDPLTIDQFEGTPRSTSEYDTRLYTAYVARFGEGGVPMALDNDPVDRLANASVDLSVIHPPQRLVGGRPDWLAMNGYRRPHEVKLEPFGERSLVRAFVAEEPDDAIAMDQILVEAGAAAVTLMLPRGNYRLVRQSEGGEDLPLGTVRID